MTTIWNLLRKIHHREAHRAADLQGGDRREEAHLVEVVVRLPIKERTRWQVKHLQVLHHNKATLLSLPGIKTTGIENRLRTESHRPQLGCRQHYFEATLSYLLRWKS